MVVLSNCETIKFDGRCQVSSTPCDFPGWTAHFMHLLSMTCLYRGMDRREQGWSGLLEEMNLKQIVSSTPEKSF